MDADDSAGAADVAAAGVWAFDVDGCLVDSLMGSSLRPGSRELLAALRNRGVVVVLWSAGGEEWARHIATRFGLGALVAAYYGKPDRGPDGRWLVEHMPPEHRPAVCVDDRPDDLPAFVVPLAVRPYLAPDEHDGEMYRILGALGAVPEGDGRGDA